MTRVAIALILTIAVAACGQVSETTGGDTGTPVPSAEPVTALTFQPGDDGAVAFAGGQYVVAWTACDWVEVAGTTLIDDLDPQDGSETVDLPAGPGYVNRSGAACVVTLTR